MVMECKSAEYNSWGAVYPHSSFLIPSFSVQEGTVILRKVLPLRYKKLHKYSTNNKPVIMKEKK